mgnify:CR=1 FL=1
MRYSTNEDHAARLTFEHCNLFEAQNEPVLKRENYLAQKMETINVYQSIGDAFRRHVDSC